MSDSGKCLAVLWYCALIAIVGCQIGEAQRGRIRGLLPGAGTTSSIEQALPSTEMDDKSRLVHATLSTNELWMQLDTHGRKAIQQLSLIEPLLARPQNRDEFLSKLDGLVALLPALQTSLEGLSDLLSRFTERRVDVPYKVALYPGVRFQEGGNRSLLALGITYSDDTVALDITGQYLRLHPPDEGWGLFVKHDLTPSKHVASRALQELAKEIQGLSMSDSRALTRLVTAVHQLVAATTRLKGTVQPVHTGVLELIPLVEEQGADPQKFQELSLHYNTLVSPFQEAAGGVQDIFGSQGEEFERFFSGFRTTTQQARAALVRAALAPHLVLTGGARSFRHLGQVGAAGFALSQQIPLAPESGVFWNLSGQYVWWKPSSGQETSGMLWGTTVAWVDKLSSFNKRGEPILRRWQWQAGIEYSPRSGLSDQLYGVFVRWRPAERVEDYLLFWAHDDSSGEETVGVGVRWLFGVEPY